MGKKWEYEEVKKFLEENGLKLLSEEYLNNKAKLKVECCCGEVFERCFQDIKNKKMTRCRGCTGSKLSYANVSEYISRQGCELVSKEYIKNCDKLDIKCECGNIYSVDFNTFKKGQNRCKKCYWKINKHHNSHDFDYVKEYVENNTECELMSEGYNGVFEYLSLKCSCGKIFKTRFSNIQKAKNVKCRKCVTEIIAQKQRSNWEDIKDEVESLAGDRFSVISCDYKNVNSKINLVCLKCNHKFKRSLNGIRYLKNQCPHCERENRKRTLEEAQEIVDSYSDEFTVIEYRNAGYIVTKHNECNHIFIGRLNSIKCSGGIVCRKCNPIDSTGVVRIISWLNKNDIMFMREKTFEGCVHIRKLYFDFYLPEYNVCIEFDGSQHFRSTELFGGKESLKITKKRDSIKNDYCKDNNIKLLRIKYTEIEAIETILEEYLQDVNTEVTNSNNID